MNCEVSKCTRDAKYALYQISIYSGEKKWLNVCTEHEQEIGDRNLEILKGGYNG